MEKRASCEQIPGLGLTLGDFWSWAYSDLLSNLNRSTFAEFLVAAALGLLDRPRIEWDAVDLRYRGQALEVKAADAEGFPRRTLYRARQALASAIVDLGNSPRALPRMS